MTCIMGVLNISPDSFSTTRPFRDHDEAVEHGLALARAGADIIDVGGESTRPGATPVPPHTERERILPVVRALVAHGVQVCVDTLHASTAAAAVHSGATLINDVSGGLADPAMAATVARTQARYVIGHWRGNPRTMNTLARYQDPVGEVIVELQHRIAAARRAGVDADRLVVDPGLGFAKEPEHNWALLSHLPRLRSLGLPVMVGASRKRFLGELLAADEPPHRRDLPTAVISVLAAQHGAWAVRVHDVAGSRTALDTLRAWQTGSPVPRLAEAVAAR